MKIFISYRFTGEDPQELERILGDVCSSLNKIGHTNYCSISDSKMFEEKKFTARQIMDYALHEIDKSDVFLALVKSERISEGMLLEAGYAIAKNKKIILLINKSIKNHTFRRLFGDRMVEFSDFDDLNKKLGGLKI